MNKVEMVEKLYGDVAFFCKMAIKNPSLRSSYCHKAAGVLHAMESVNLISIREFCFTIELLWNNTNSRFNYANDKAGYIYEI